MNILIGFCEVKYTVNTPIIITIVVNKITTPRAVATGYVDHHEYCLNKNIFYFIKNIREEN